MKKFLLPGLILCCLLHGCAAPSGQSTEQSYPQETDAPSLAALVRWEEDEYLADACASQADALERLRVKAVYPDIHLSAEEDNAAMALFTIEGTPHAAGAERTIALLFDPETASVLDQVTIVADDVTPYILDGSHVLFLNTVSYAGMSSYSLSILQATSSGWVSMDPNDLFPAPLPYEETAELCYAVTGDDPLLLHVLEPVYGSYPMAPPDYIYQQTFLWDKEAHCFLLSSADGFAK